MTPSALTTSLRVFFERFDAADDTDPASGADLFHGQFLSLDPNGVTVVTREQLRAVLPMRAQMFGSIGATGTRLRDLEARSLDDRHVLAETTWDVELEGADADPLVLHSTYLLRREAEDWSVVVYLNHQDIGRVLADRSPPERPWDAWVLLDGDQGRRARALGARRIHGRAPWPASFWARRRRVLASAVRNGSASQTPAT